MPVATIRFHNLDELLSQLDQLIAGFDPSDPDRLDHEWKVLRSWVRHATPLNLIPRSGGFTKSESPDFIMADALGNRTGIEITRITNREFQEFDRELSRSSEAAEVEPGDGFVECLQEKNWAQAAAKIYGNKTEKMISSKYEPCSTYRIIMASFYLGENGMDWCCAIRNFRNEVSGDGPAVDVLHPCGPSMMVLGT